MAQTKAFIVHCTIRNTFAKVKITLSYISIVQSILSYSKIIIIFLFASLGVSSVFYVVAFISFVQLMICCVAEYQRLKQPSFLRACRITTQKFLYFVVFLAAILRGAYFTTPVSLSLKVNFPLYQTCKFSLLLLFI